MSGQGQHATSNMDRRQLGARHRLDVPARRLMLVGALVAAVLLGVVSVASASSSFYWYGENSITCWQTGSLGSGSSTCDSVGESYLLSHMRAGGIGVDVELVNSGTSGDYCNYYNIGEGLDTTNENEQGGLTGFNPTTPFGAYQEGNHYNPPDVCQAYSDGWGQVVRGNSANKKCEAPYAPCGMQHFVSLGGQGTNDRPWSNVFGSPALVISAEDNPHTIEAPNAWGYICPLLKSPSGAILEYCLEAWHVGSGSFPAYKHADEAGPCNFGAGQTFTEFLPATKFAELVSGSSETFEYKNNFASRTFTARITPSDLEAAISAVEAHGCGAQSHNTSEYALVGIEQGTEGGGLTTLGESTAHLEAWTTYTPLPPETTTSGPTEIRPLQATFNGTVNPRGNEAHYYFKYGTTTSYGSTTSEGSTNTGESPEGEHTTVTGLQPGTTYHYRLVAHTEGGTTEGGDQEFKTPGPVEAVTGVVSGLTEEQATLNGTVNPKGYDSKYYFQYGTTTSYGSVTSEGDAGAGSSPVPESAVLTKLAYGTVYHYRLVGTSGGVTSYGADQKFTTQDEPSSSRWIDNNPDTGETAVYYRNSSGAVAWWQWHAITGWEKGVLGGAMASGTTPAVLYSPSTGETSVYYQNSSHEMAFWQWSPGRGWASGTLGGHMAASTSPAGVVNWSSPETTIYYQNSSSEIAFWQWHLGKGWESGTLGGHAAAGSTPGVLYEPANGETSVYYPNSSHEMAFWQWQPGKGWVSGVLGGHVAANTSPAVVLDRSLPETVIYYQNSSGEVAYWDWAKGWTNGTLGGHMAANTSPAVVVNWSLPETVVYYQNSSGEVAYWDWSKGWGNGTLGGHVAASTSPAVVVDWSLPETSLYYQNSSGEFGFWQWQLGKGWVNGVV
jgi:hypothetical protein